MKGVLKKLGFDILISSEDAVIEQIERALKQVEPLLEKYSLDFVSYLSGHGGQLGGSANDDTYLIVRKENGTAAIDVQAPNLNIPAMVKGIIEKAKEAGPGLTCAVVIPDLCRDRPQPPTSNGNPNTCFPGSGHKQKWNFGNQPEHTLV